MDVVVVESPAKAKTINRYLGQGFIVLASYGHVRDLPSKDGSVRPEENFAMTYVPDPGAAKHLTKIAKALKGAKHLYLATDPDREGEAISWHVLEALVERKAMKDITVKRIAFNEVTERAVLDALKHPRDLDMDLVYAQQARRALDYLVGFTLSPVLWRKLPGARSAGRVQSVALRLICERELEIEAFSPREYWSIEGQFFTADAEPFKSRLTHLDGEKLTKFSIDNESLAREAVTKAKAAPGYAISLVEAKQNQRHPPPPFRTSTLQQEAARKLRFSASHTMRVAQRLYEGVNIDGQTVGLISYMRTDGVQMAQEAVNNCRNIIDHLYGTAYVPTKPKFHSTKAKNAQEAHEAIRPTDFKRLPKEIASSLEQDQAKLYELIWNRAVSSQMKSALLERTSVDILATDESVMFRTNGTITIFDGFLRLYREGRDDQKDEEDEDSLPRLTKSQKVLEQKIEPTQHFTEPPPRFSEATLVKKLEDLGIGRPSTYASIISVLRDREYVRMDRNRFIPEDRGRLVTAFLTSFFRHYVEYDFTAELENKLDDISAGRAKWTNVLGEFWNPFNSTVGEISELRVRDVLDTLNDVLGPYIFHHDDPNADPRACPTCSDGRLSVKTGRFGAFVGCSNYPTCRHTRALTATANTGDRDGEGENNSPRELGSDPETGLLVSARQGPYGPYVQRGEAGEENKPHRVSLPKGVEFLHVNLDTALKLLSLPRVVGRHPETGKNITAAIGRYGPYIRHEKESRSLETDDDILEIGLNRAVSLLAEPKTTRRSGGEELRNLGSHPEDDKPIRILKGRYGPYVKHGKTNAPIPKDLEAIDITLDKALELLGKRLKRTNRAGRKRKIG